MVLYPKSPKTTIFHWFSYGYQPFQQDIMPRNAYGWTRTGPPSAHLFLCCLQVESKNPTLRSRIPNLDTPLFKTSRAWKNTFVKSVLRRFGFESVPPGLVQEWDAPQIQFLVCTLLERTPLCSKGTSWYIIWKWAIYTSSQTLTKTVRHSHFSMCTIFSTYRVIKIN